MKKRILLAFILGLLFALTFTVVLAQDSPFSLRIVRDWGYGNGSDINGRMSLSIKGDEDQVRQVSFLMDGELMATVTAKPFKTQFDTNSYEPGIHHMTAEVTTTSGETFATNTIVSNFVEKAAANQSTYKILLFVGGIAAASIVIQFLMQRNAKKNPNTSQNGQIQYGAWGGAVCPSCGKPFNRSFFGINLGVRLERCPNCGKFVVSRRATPEQLDAAERRFRPKPEAYLPGISDIEKEHQTYNDSKYTDL